jgi:hypothetical protein
MNTPTGCGGTQSEEHAWITRTMGGGRPKLENVAVHPKIFPNKVREFRAESLDSIKKLSH